MSCRVIGLDVEKSVLTHIMHDLKFKTITADVIQTPSNFVCHELFRQSGFTKKENIWCYEIPSTSSVNLDQIELIISANV
jgi:predicted enzyme involved in methoxymalonyl-ACP biosynthesis